MPKVPVPESHEPVSRMRVGHLPPIPSMPREAGASSERRAPAAVARDALAHRLAGSAPAQNPGMVFAAAGEMGDPYALSGPLVTQGLYQLLEEWKLFSNSGFFGTGPSGIEHPLYATLAPLTMGVIMAGRFDGSTPEILDSIKDYAAAWQHEQAILYTRIETFDHYLRRVVQKILKRRQGIAV